MCQDEGLAIVPWAALGGGALLTKEQRQKIEGDPKARKISADENNVRVSEVLEQLATNHKSTLQSVVSQYQLR